MFLYHVYPYLPKTLTLSEAVLNRLLVKRIILPIILLLTVLFPPISAMAQQNEAASAISAAKQQLISCYDSAEKAEGAGANISSLTSVLDDAGDLLSQSELAYSQGNYDTAQSLAAQSSQQLSTFVSDANSLKDAAVQQANFNFYVYLVGSSVGAVAIIIAGCGVWFLINKRSRQVGEQSHGTAGL